MPILRSTPHAGTAAGLAACLALLLAGGAGATDIVYQPVNPAFGG